MSIEQVIESVKAAPPGSPLAKLAPYINKNADSFEKPVDRSDLCKHLGDIFDRCPLQLPVFDVRECDLHGYCTREKTDRRVSVEVSRVCATCGDYSPDTSLSVKPLISRLEWVSTRQLAYDTIHLLLPKLPVHLSGIVGIPRSGMIPAAILATMLHMPLYSLFGQLRQVGYGGRGKSMPFAADNTAPLLVVDDTIHGGMSMDCAKKNIGGRQAIYSAVYVLPSAISQADIYGRTLPGPHLLEWNIFNNFPLAGYASDPVLAQKGLAFDFDGIICREHNPNAPLYLSRRIKIPLIITGRGEEHRQATEGFMHRWGVKWQRLVMRPSNVGLTDEAIAAWKGKVFKESPQAIFLESKENQAAIIARVSGKPAICPATERVFQP